MNTATEQTDTTLGIKQEDISVRSIGEIFRGIPPEIRQAIKVKFKVESKVSNRANTWSKSLEIGALKVDNDENLIQSLAKTTKILESAVRNQPNNLIRLVQTFERPSSEADRKRALAQAKSLGFFSNSDTEPESAALIGGILLIGAALLLTACPPPDDTCPTAGPCPDGGSSGSSGSDG